MIKRIVSTVLLLSLAFCFTACGKSENGKKAWPADAFFGDTVPPAADEVSNVEKFGKKGSRRVVIDIDDYSYEAFLDYVDRLEAKGFVEYFEKNSIYPTEPSREKAVFASNNVEGACLIIYWYPKDYPGYQYSLTMQITENDTIDQ